MLTFLRRSVKYHQIFVQPVKSQRCRRRLLSHAVAHFLVLGCRHMRLLLKAVDNVIHKVASEPAVDMLWVYHFPAQRIHFGSSPIVARVSLHDQKTHDSGKVVQNSRLLLSPWSWLRARERGALNRQERLV